MAYTTINKPSDYFNTKLYTGNGSTQSITGVGFQPDFTWIKERDTSNEYHNLYDVIRGATNAIYSNDILAESTQTGLTSFDSDGFSVGSFDIANKNTSGYVSWNWLAGGSASSNTDGSITSNVSANTTAGFSIVSYTGTGANATVGHGLGVAPAMVIVKIRSAAGENWNCYHSALGGTQYIQLNNTNAAGTASNIWQDTNPTSSVFSIGTHGSVNTSSATYIAYCFSEVKGFSKFGSYTGNGSTDGTFVYTGFKPAFVIVKETGDGNWLMKDNKRPIYNQNNQYLYANGSDSEFTNSVVGMDFLSNGFKCRGTAGDMNGSGITIIYMAFAENPLVTTGKVPATAR